MQSLRQEAWRNWRIDSKSGCQDWTSTSFFKNAFQCSIQYAFNLHGNSERIFVAIFGKNISSSRRFFQKSSSWFWSPLVKVSRTGFQRSDYDIETYKDRESHRKSGIIQYENYPRVDTSLGNLIRFQFHFVQSDVRSAVWSTTNAMTKPMLSFSKTDFRNHTNNIASLL